MAILSNINGRFAVEDDGAIQFNGQAGTSGYVLESRGASSPPVWTDRDTGNVTGSGAANRVTYWSSATNVTSDAGFTYNGAGRVNTDESFGVSKDGADAVADGPFFRLTNAVQDRQYLWQLDASNNIDYWYYNGSAWAQTISLLNDGGATFGGTVTAPRIGIPGANSSFALYNDSNSYFNGAVTVDSTFTQTGGAASSFSGDVTANGNVTIANTSPDLYLFPTGSFHSFRVSAQENVANTFEITPSTTAGGSTYSNPALSISHTGNSTFAGNVEFDKNVWQDISTNGGYIMRPNGADYVTTTGTVTGAIEIRIPTGGAGKDDMIKFVVDIYDYATQESITVFIGGYIYQAVGGNTWINVSAQIISTDSSKNYTVRFGDNGSVHCVWIGETDSTWSYPQILVRDFYGGFATNVEDYLATWDITYVTSITTVNNTLTNNFPMSHGGTTDAFWSANGNNIYNDNSGNVGIGETSPSQKLNVRDDGGSDVFRGIEVHNNNTSLARAGISFKCYDWVQSAIWHGRSATAAYGGALVLGTNPDTSDLSVSGVTGRMWILNNGNVGIGTDSPQAPLSFDNIVGDKIDFYHNVTGSDRYGVEVQSSELRIFSGAQGASTGGITFGKKTTSTFTEAMRIRNDGNVGIGDTTPSFPLVVSKSSSNTTNSGDASMRLALSNPDQTNNNYALITFGDGTSQPGSGFMGMQFTDHANNYGDLVFGTRGGGGYGERMRIDSSGQIQLNAYDGTNKTGTPTYLLGADASGNIVKTITGATTGTQVHSLAATGGTASWKKLGTFTAAMGGQSVFIKMVTNAGYNSSISQNVEVYIRFKTSNGGSLDPNGFSGDSSFYTHGPNASFPAGNIKWVSNAAGTSATSYALYALIPNYSGNGGFYVVENSAGTWVNNMSNVSDPGAASSTVMIPAEQFRVGSTDLVVNGGGGDAYFANSNVGIGTTAPVHPLQVNGDYTNGLAGLYSTATTTYNSAAYVSNSVLSLQRTNNADNYPVGIRYSHVGQTEMFTGIVRQSSTISAIKYAWQGYNGSAYQEFGSINCYSTGAGTLTMAGDIVAYSDKKLKKNIKTLDGSKVYEMRGVSFDRIDTGKKSSGVIAQEIQKIAPELISESNETLGVAYGNISGYLIEAIKELKAEIEELKKCKCDCKK